MAIALLTHTAGQSTDQSTVTSPAIDTTGANLLILAVGHYGPGSTMTISDSKGNSWTPLTEYNVSGSSTGVTLYYSVPTSVGTSHTFSTSSGGFTYPTIVVSAWSGAAASLPFDVQNGNFGTGNPMSTGNITPSQNNELVITAVGYDKSGEPASVDSGFTIIDGFAYTNANGEGTYLAYIVQGTAAAVNPAWTRAVNAGFEMAVAIASFKAAAALGTPIWTLSFVHS